MVELLLGRYRRVTELGRGAMGQVWLAEDLVLGRQVAIKALRGGIDTVSSERMAREARAAARLHHPHAVSVFDFVVADGQPYLIMEYVAGSSLSEALSRGDRIDAAAVLHEIAGALGEAAGLGIVHRDIKPANVLINHRGVAKLADFGIARTSGDAALTGTGNLIGTLAFMAPEVARGEPATAASDVWSLGATIYAILEGHAPYHADAEEHMVAMLQRITTQPVPPITQRSAMSTLVMRMLHVDPEHRPTAVEVEREAARIARESSRTTVSRPAHALPAAPRSQGSPRRNIRIMVGALVLACLATAGGIVWAIHPWSGASRAPRALTTIPPLLKAGQVGTRARIPWSAVGPDWVLLSTTPTKDVKYGQAGALYLVDPLGGRYRIASLPARTDVLDWSPSARKAFLGGQKYLIVNLTNGAFTPVPDPGFENGYGGFADQRANSLRAGGQGFEWIESLTRKSTRFPDRVSGLGGIGNQLLIVSASGNVAFGAEHGIAIFAPDGRLVNAIDAPKNYEQCAPLRLLSDGELIEQCNRKGRQDLQPVFFADSLSGGHPTNLDVPQPPAHTGVYDIPLQSGTGWVYPYTQQVDCRSSNGIYKSNAGFPTKLDITGADSSTALWTILAAEGDNDLVALSKCSSHPQDQPFPPYDEIGVLNTATNTLRIFITTGSPDYITGAVPYPGEVPLDP